MKKKWWIIPICIIAFIGILFGVQHFLLKEYGCYIEYTCIEGYCGMLTPNNSTSEHICSFKTFLINEDVSEKLFLWFGIDTRSLKEKPKEELEELPLDKPLLRSLFK